MFTDSSFLPNLLYLFLVIGLWLAAMAAVTPGTGALELTALTALAVAGVGTLSTPFNPWAFLPLAVGVVLFALSLWRRQEAVWLALSAIVLSVGSAYLYATPAGGPAVHPLLASVVSLATVGFFWVTIRRSLAAHKARRAHDLGLVMGQVGEARTPLDPVGTVQVAGELWSGRSGNRVAAGRKIRVVGRDGFVLEVEAMDESTPISKREEAS
ncbi:MAG TPA: NfeD family protein [Anaerolineales bacterium]|nr:NfeD family protein [Anaerolineales bacterium]